MTVRYQVRVYNQSGVQVAALDDGGAFRGFTFRQSLGAAGSYALAMSAQDDRVDLFDLDAQVIFFRKVVSELTGVVEKDWYREFNGLHRVPVHTVGDDGNFEFQSVGASYNELLARRIIAYKAGEPEAVKSGVAETVMKEYTDENIGPSALASNGRLADGDLTGFSIEADGAAGAQWDGSRAYQNLLKVLNEISTKTGLYFRVVHDGAAQFLFETFAGTDRTNQGLDHSTGLNGAGNVPVVFTVERGTMRDVSYQNNRLDESNRVFVGGQGQKSIREVRKRETPALQTDSPFNLRETMLNATQEASTDGLDSAGDQLLAELAPQESFDFKVVQGEGARYGVDYFLGDLVTVRFEEVGLESDLRLTGVTVTYKDGDEDLQHDFEEVA